MLMTSTKTLFDAATEGMNSAILNICDCFGNVSSQINIQFRVRYPGSYAADQMTKRGDRHKLGTVSYTLENGLIIINAYICYNFNDQRSIIEGTLFDPTCLLSCLYQITDILSDLSCDTLFLSVNSFHKFNIPIKSLMELLTYYGNYVPYSLVVTV